MKNFKKLFIVFLFTLVACQQVEAAKRLVPSRIIKQKKTKKQRPLDQQPDVSEKDSRDPLENKDVFEQVVEDARKGVTDNKWEVRRDALNLFYELVCYGYSPVFCDATKAAQDNFNDEDNLVQLAVLELLYVLVQCHQPAFCVAEQAVVAENIVNSTTLFVLDTAKDLKDLLIKGPVRRSERIAKRKAESQTV